jgi:hypothetical protein
MYVNASIAAACTFPLSLHHYQYTWLKPKKSPKSAISSSSRNNPFVPQMKRSAHAIGRGPSSVEAFESHTGCDYRCTLCADNPAVSTARRPPRRIGRWDPGISIPATRKPRELIPTLPPWRRGGPPDCRTRTRNRRETYEGGNLRQSMRTRLWGRHCSFHDSNPPSIATHCRPCRTSRRHSVGSVRPAMCRYSRHCAPRSKSGLRKPIHLHALPVSRAIPRRRARSRRHASSSAGNAGSL